MTAPHLLTATRLAAAVRAGEVSASEVVEACLDRIARLDSSLQAWVVVDAAGARAAARQLDQEARAGRLRGPLHGVPVGVKDIIDVAGLTTTSGAPPFAHRRPERDAACVARLRAAGAVIVGKTATTPFAYADPAPTRNPWNLDHTPGGSSSGSAAAVAARMVPLALGTQTIGSTLRPASYCGIVGLKGTYGAVSLEGVTPLSWSLDHLGIFARSVDDVAAAFAALAETPPPPQAGAEAASPRLGIPRAFVEEVAAPDVLRHFRSAADTLARAGARVDDIALPPSSREIDASGRRVLAVEAAAYHRAWFAQHAAQYPPRIRDLVETGLQITGVEFVDAEHTRQRFRQEMLPILSRYDALLLPAASTPAPPLTEGTTGDPVLNAPWSFGGFPAIAVPSGLLGGGLPVAIQLVAGPHADGRLLAVARWCENILGFAHSPTLSL
ncbi:MAG: amidase [Armatimonadota bacterium]|nr:amidase [Armatimonadota bacterium]